MAHQLYANGILRRPTKTLDETKRIKAEVENACGSDLVEFIGLVPSLSHDLDCQNVYKTDLITARRLKWILQQILDSYDKHYELKREKGSEAVVFLSCDLDRRWDENKIRCAPICWFTKGYSLDTETMRRILEAVLNACFMEGMHVPAISFDEQWHNIAVRESNGLPLTLLQLQKDVCKSVESMSKRSIMKEIESLNSFSTWHFENLREDEENAKRVIVCTNNNAHLPRISSRLKYVRTKEVQPKSKDESAKVSPHQNEELDQFQENIHDDIIQDASASNPFETTIENESHGDANENLVNGSSEQHQGITEDHGVNDVTDINREQFENLEKEPFDISSATAILAMLRTDPKCNNKHQWIEKSPHDIQNIMGSYKLLKSLRDIELKIVVRFLKKTSKLKINESDSKESKLTKLSNYLKIEQEQVIKHVQTRKSKNQNVKALSDLAYNVMIKSVKKVHLNIIYGEYTWRSKCQTWYTKFPLKLTYPDIKVSTDVLSDLIETNNTERTKDIHEIIDGSFEDPKVSDESTSSDCGFFYCPSYSAARQQVEISCVDSSHLLTRTRRKICKGGLNGITNAAWRKVAKSKNTNLSLGMIDCILEPMSVPVAVTHISERVEMEMRRNGDHDAADLCRDIQLWWRAEDDPGIKSEERFKMRLPLRNRLLKCHDVAHFPLPGMYVNGWPAQLWEALLANIDSKYILYHLTSEKTYNVRVFSSMMGETFFSELTLYDRRGQGTVTAKEFGQFIQDSVEKIHMRLDPDR